MTERRDDRQPLTGRSVSDAPIVGIFSLFFREAGYWWAQAYERVDEGVREFSLDARNREARRRAEAEARLLEEMRRAKEAGIDPEAVLRRAYLTPPPDTTIR
jgi:hypothetical protein